MEGYADKEARMPGALPAAGDWSIPAPNWKRFWKSKGARCGEAGSAGRERRDMISTEYAYLYPPGIPLIVPGERITEEVCRYVCCLSGHWDLPLEGLKKKKDSIEVLEEWVRYTI